MLIKSDNQIIIKSDKENIGMIISLFVVCVLFLLISFEVCDSLVAIVIPNFILAMIGFHYWILTGRSYIMDKDGCTICFLFYKKKYLWGQLKYKYIENYRNVIFPLESPYLKGVIFSLTIINRPNWLSGMHYYACKPFPINSIFINFYLKGQKKERYEMMYTVDEVQFMEKMREWGIELKEKL